MDPSSLPETPRGNSDIDFNDVFGGQRRRPSNQETRYSFGENNTDSSYAFRRSDAPVRRNPWSGLSEKPAFGEEEMRIGRISRSKSDFFDDIFKGNESSSSSPRKYEMKDPLPSADFRHPSLLAQMNKRMDLPTFVSSTRTKSKSNEGSLNDLSYYASSSMSKAELRNGFPSSYCFSGGNEESTNLNKNFETGIKGNSNEDSRSSEVSRSGSRFHFSIHKWARKGGMPVVIPPGGSYKLQRWSSANGRSIAKEPRDKMHNRFCSIDEVSSKFRSFGLEHGKNENAAPHKLQPKTLNSLLDDDNDDEHGNAEIARNSGSIDMSEMSAKKLSEIVDDKNTKKQDVKKRVTSNSVEASTRSIKHFPRKSWDNGKARVRGKVKELIKIFNQDATSKPRTGAALSENHGSSRRERDTVKPENESNNSMNKRVEKIHLNNMLKKKSYSDFPVANRMYNGASEKNIDSSVRDTEDPAELFEDYILIEDLPPEEKISPQFGIDPEEIKAIDNKIRQWSNGKQSNIRSLLSTLQYVLWTDSGWKPVPLVDIIEAPDVKRSYQKALLCLHPDKLQQKSAASDEKYIARQVFDILQDAWTYFNSLRSDLPFVRS